MSGVQASTTQTLDNKLWMKTIVHVTGGSDSSETSLFNFYMSQYANVIQDTLYGGNVNSFAKTSNSAVQLLAGQQIESLFDQHWN